MSDDRFRLLFENSLDAIVVADDDGQYIDVNPAACELFGYSREQMLRMCVGDLATPSAPAADQYGEYLNQGKARGEFVFLRADGQRRVASFSACHFAADQNLSILRDITDQTDAREAARRASEFTETAIDSLPGIFYVIDANERFLRWNHNLEEVTGYSAGEIVGMHPTDFFMGEERQLIAERIREVYATGTAAAEAELVSKNGATTPFFFTGRLTNLDGKPCLVGMGIDISERRRLDKELREETETLRTIHRIGQVLSAELDLEKLVQATTDAATELTGAQFGAFFYNVVNAAGESYTLYTISGVPRQLFSQFPMPRNTDIFAPTFAGEATVRLADVRQDLRYGHSAPYFGMPPGHLPVVSCLAVPVVSRSGAVLGGLFFGHSRPNIFTERHERIVEGLGAQAAIAIDNARLFRAEQERSDQLRIAISEVHHRVKNSLQSVAALLEMQLPDEGTTMPVEAVKDSLSQIKTISLVHDLLARDKPMGSVDAARVLVNLGRLLTSGMSIGQPQMRIDVDAEPLEMSTRTATSLALAVNEILTNAAKHQAPPLSTGDAEARGAYVIAVSLRRIDDMVSVAVKDPGPGFQPGFDPDRDAGIGLRLIQTLAGHDLRGSARFSNIFDPAQPSRPAGAQVEILFPITVCSED